MRVGWLFGNMTLHEPPGRVTLDDRSCGTPSGAAFYIPGISWLDVEAAQRLVEKLAIACQIRTQTKGETRTVRMGMSYELDCDSVTITERVKLDQFLISQGVAMP